MQLTNLQPAIVIQRYKRFLIDFYFANNPTTILTAHCPNSGALPYLQKNCTIYVTPSTSPTAKLKYSAVLHKQNNNLICINTMFANKIVHNALLNQQIQPLSQYTQIKPEFKYLNSRFDFALNPINNNPQVLVEVKSVSLTRQNNLAEFPDAKTTRGQKHLQDLITAKQNGVRAVMLYLVLINNITSFTLAKDIDPTYYALAQQCKQAGVEFLCYGCNVSTTQITFGNLIPITL